jgi:aspartyl-tRNA(Asn)/glutamyl-tRNA(Gln) amidotransferase subunit C
MIDRDDVRHVAALARLELSDEEVERMALELNAVLENMAKISELDLEGVEPTSHVVALENVFRADVPWTSLPPEVALASAPEPFEGAFRVPSPQAPVD